VPDRATGELDLLGVLVEAATDGSIVAAGIRIRESELRGLSIDAPDASGLELVDVVLRDCDLSNVDGREGQIRRVKIDRSRLVGFSLSAGRARDLRVADSSLALASFAAAGLQDVVFEDVNLAEATFMEARLKSVEFIGCRLEGADFRGARLTNCAIRGSSLDGVLGVEALRGLRMPYGDILASAAAMAAALGIVIDAPDDDG
jgi:uncharacterized protein YjbI with pentapeptide repeats